MEQIKNLEGAALYKRELGNANRGTYAKGTYMCTYTGKEFYPLDPNIEAINITDIGHALSNCCRFTGHVKQFYSVAQHSVIVSQLCNPENALCGLLHDASEAYLSDIARPVKYTEAMEGYRQIEHGLEQAICSKFNLPFPMPKDVKAADDMALMAEAFVLFTPTPTWVFQRLSGVGLTKPTYKLESCWTPPIAKALFMRRFYELSGVKISTPTQEELDAETKEN
jgi:uncharacterized protein